MPEKKISCCFTGHRPNKLPWGTDEEDSRCTELKAQIAQKLAEIYDRGYRHFICGMAIGCDLYFFEEVLALRQRHPDVTAEAAVPCPSQPNAWPDDIKEKYYRFLESADRVTMVSQTYSKGCMMKRNRYMVDSSSLILACFNGTSGGTMSTLLYAMRSGLEKVQIDIE